MTREQEVDSTHEADQIVRLFRTQETLEAKIEHLERRLNTRLETPELDSCALLWLVPQGFPVSSGGGTIFNRPSFPSEFEEPFIVSTNYDVLLETFGLGGERTFAQLLSKGSAGQLAKQLAILKPLEDFSTVDFGGQILPDSDVLGQAENDSTTHQPDVREAIVSGTLVGATIGLSVAAATAAAISSLLESVPYTCAFGIAAVVFGLVAMASLTRVRGPNAE